LKIDLCIATHSPSLVVFTLVPKAIARQTVTRESFQVSIIDIASTPPRTEAEFVPLWQGNILHTLVWEARLGNAHGRAKAIKVIPSEWIVFVDDDNELAEAYLAAVVDVAQQKPHLGCFGRKLPLPSGYQAVPWLQPVIPCLAIKDCGDEADANCVDHLGVWEPPTAGAAVRRPVLQLVSERMRQIGNTGHRGRKGLVSCEDGLMVRDAAGDLNLAGGATEVVAPVGVEDYGEGNLRQGEALAKEGGAHEHIEHAFARFLDEILNLARERLTSNPWVNQTSRPDDQLRDAAFRPPQFI
jgi:hypothetical protein